MILRKTGEGWPVIVQESRTTDELAVRTDGTLYLDEVDLIAQSSPRAYGAVLGRALFRDAIAEALIRARVRSPEALHVTLMIDDPGLRTLRWERLCARIDQAWEFLRLDQRTPFSLHVPAQTDRVYPSSARSAQRALVLVANPSNLGDYKLAPFDALRAATTVREALAGVPCDVLAHDVPGAAGPPTLDALCQRLTSQVYTILHIVAHGAMMPRTGETVLYLATASGSVDAVPAGEFVQRLGRLGGGVGLPHLIFVAGCETAAPEARGSAGGLALRLAQDLGTPAVVAMTDRVSVATIETMVRPFYHRLMDHGLVDLALSEACSQMAERTDLTVPVLYSRLHGKSLFHGEGAATLGERRITDRLRIVGASIDLHEPARPNLRRWARRLAPFVGIDDVLALLQLGWPAEAPPQPLPKATATKTPALAATPAPPRAPRYRYDVRVTSTELPAGYTPTYIKKWSVPYCARMSGCFNEHTTDIGSGNSIFFILKVGADGVITALDAPVPGTHTAELDACVGEILLGAALDPPPIGAASEVRIGLALTRVELP